MKLFKLTPFNGYRNEADAEAGSDTGIITEENNTSDADAVAEALSSDETPKGWQWSEGVNGEGDRPEWFKEKYKSVDEQAKAYGELESRFGSFTGAPEEYAIQLSDELADAGIEFDNDDPLIEEAMKFAKDSNMSQEGFNNMLELYASIQAAEQKNIEELRAQEFEALGERGKERIDNINAWGKANLSTEQYEGLEEAATSAKAVAAIERLIAMGRAAPVQPDAAVSRPSVTPEQVRAMQFEKDEHGNRRINTDPEFRKRFKAMSLQVHGAEDHQIIIG